MREWWRGIVRLALAPSKLQNLYPLLFTLAPEVYQQLRRGIFISARGGICFTADWIKHRVVVLYVLQDHPLDAFYGGVNETHCRGGNSVHFSYH
jgi:hypothetical protein